MPNIISTVVFCLLAALSSIAQSKTYHLVTKEELPSEFKGLSAEESHHCLCAMKTELSQVNRNER